MAMESHKSLGQSRKEMAKLKELFSHHGVLVERGL
jgi:hypothetical protein